MKLLIIPDVHGRDFWMDPCHHIDDFDKCIFLGDYHDPYPTQVSQDTSRHRLRELVSFVTANKDKVVCLLGNHDANYLVCECSNRIDYFHKKEITKLLEQLPIQLVYDEIPGYLFSHSGVLPAWVDNWELDVHHLNDVPFTDKSLLAVSPIRGGWSNCGSCIWGDVTEYADAYHYKDWYQIFGHTQLIDSPIITDDFACLDCRKAFVLNTETKELKLFEKK